MRKKNKLLKTNYYSLPETLFYFWYFLPNETVVISYILILILPVTTFKKHIRPIRQNVA